MRMLLMSGFHLFGFFSHSLHSLFPRHFGACGMVYFSLSPLRIYTILLFFLFFLFLLFTDTALEQQA
jgi:hypothetical protein